MTERIRIVTAEVQMAAVLNKSKTAALLRNALPISGEVNTWGDEIYFAIPVRTGPENAVDVVEEGDLAYWPEGSCFCIFFGKTPTSTENEIKPASPVNLIGRLEGDPAIWKQVSTGSGIRLELCEDD